MNKEIKDLTINEWIWLVFIILSIANIYGDELEISTIKEEHKHNKKAKKLFLITASVSLIIYFYLTIRSYNKYKNIKQKNKDTSLFQYNLLGNIFVLVGAILLIYFNYKTKDNIELPETVD